ncbi:hypothetical protein EJB05_25729, partial [Eragrostis curvula]
MHDHTSSSVSSRTPPPRPAAEEIDSDEDVLQRSEERGNAGGEDVPQAPSPAPLGRHQTLQAQGLKATKSQGGATTASTGDPLTTVTLIQSLLFKLRTGAVIDDCTPPSDDTTVDANGEQINFKWSQKNVEQMLRGRIRLVHRKTPHWIIQRIQMLTKMASKLMKSSPQSVKEMHSGSISVARVKLLCWTIQGIPCP